MPDTSPDVALDPNTLLWLLAAAGMFVLVWVGTALFAFWRIGRQSARIETLEETAALAEKALDRLTARPIWIWADGRVEANIVAQKLLQSKERLQSVEDLAIALNAWQDPVLQNLDWSGWVEILSESNDSVTLKPGANNCPVDKPVENADKRTSLTVRLDDLPGLKPHLPDRILWIRPRDRAFSEDFADFQGIPEPETKSLWSAFYLSPIPAAIHGPTGIIRYVNTAYLKAVGAESLQQIVLDQIHLCEAPPVALIKRALQEGRTVAESLYGLTLGRRATFTCSANALPDETILVQYQDISEETEAKKENARLISTQVELLNRLRTPIAIFSGDRTLQYFNHSFCRISKLDADFLEGNIDHGDLLDAMRANRRVPEQIDYQQWKISKLEAYTRTLEAEEELWHLSDGSTLRVVTQPYLTEGLLLLFEDITDALTLERRYNTLIAVQQQTLDNLEEGVAVFSEDARLRLANAAFYDLWAIPEKQDDERLLVRDLAPYMISKQANFFDTSGQPLDIIECLPIWITNRQEKYGRVVIADDSYMDYSLTILPDGGALWALNDTTSSERVRNALIERNQALESADRLRSEFITSISYELRIPLNSITGFAELMDLGVGGSLSDTQKGYVADILSAANQLQVMIGDVLDLAVLQSGKLELDLNEFDPEPVLVDAIGFASELLSRNTIKVEGSIGSLPQIRADELRLKQIVINLLSAAAVFTPRGSVLHYEAGSDQESLTLLIDIASSGASSYQRDRTVTALSRGEMPERRRSTGISLSLARNIVSLHGGSIAIYNLGETGIRIAASMPLVGPDGGESDRPPEGYQPLPEKLVAQPQPEP